MIDDFEVARVNGNSWSIVLCRLQEEKEFLDYDDDYEVIGHKLLFFSEQSDSVQDSVKCLPEFFAKNSVDIHDFGYDQLSELAKLLVEVHNLGKYVDVNSQIYKEVAESNGVSLEEQSPRVVENTFRFVVYRSHLLFNDSGFFLVSISTNDYTSHNLEQL